MLVQRLAGFHHFNQFVRETRKYRKTCLRIIKVVFLVKHVVQKYIILPQKAFEYVFSDQLRYFLFLTPMLEVVIRALPHKALGGCEDGKTYTLSRNPNAAAVQHQRCKKR